MQLPSSPFLDSPFLETPVTASVVSIDKPQDTTLLEPQSLLDELEAISNYGPKRAEFAITSMNCLMLLSRQLLNSCLQGFDLAVLLFLMGHFHHKRIRLPLNASEIASALDRDSSQVRRSISKLKRHGWLLDDGQGGLILNNRLLRSANPRYQAMGQRLTHERFVSRR